MKHTVSFYFDHIPGMASESIYPFRNEIRQPLEGFRRYHVTVTFDDGALPVESVCLDAGQVAGVALTVDGSAKYEFPDR